MSLLLLLAGDAGTSDSGVLAGSTSPASGALAGDVIGSGALAGSTSPASGALAGTVTQSGALAGVTSPASGALSSASTTTGALAGTTSPAAGALTGTETQTGALAGSVSPASGALTGKVPVPWATRLATASTSAASWVAIGDSITEGYGASTRTNRWIDRVLTTFRNYAGVSGGGRGFIPCEYIETTWSDSSISLSGTNSESTTAGFGYRGRSLGASGQVAWTVTGTDADIWWKQVSGGGSFTWKVDAGSTTTVNTSGTSSWQRTTISLGTAGSHTVTVARTAGTVIVGGLVAYNGDATAGVQLYDAAASGIRSDQYIGAAAFDAGTPEYSLFKGALATVAPDLVSVFLGVNDGLQNTATPSQVATNLTTLISDLQALAKPPHIVLIASYDQPDSVTAWSSYVTAIQGVATAKSVTFLNLYSLLPSASDSSFSADGVHPNDAGQILVRDAFAAAVGTNVASGALAGTTSPAAGALTGGVIDSGALAGTTSPAAGALAGTETQTGALAGSTSPAAGAIPGTVTAPTALAGATSPAAGALTAGVVDSGALAGATSPVVGGMFAGSVIAGALAGATSPAAGALAASVTDSGALACATSPAAGVLAGTVTQSGALAGTTSPASGALTTSSTTAGALAGTAPSPMVGALAGTSYLAAVLAGATSPASAALAGGVQAAGAVGGTTPVLSGALAGAVRASGVLAGLTSPAYAEINRAPVIFYPLHAGAVIDNRPVYRAGTPT